MITKRRTRFFPMLAVFALSNCWLATAQEGMREFTSADGRKLTAKLVGVESGEVELEKSDGKTITVPLLSLSEPDREFADLWATHPSRLKTSSGPKPDPEAPPAPAGFLREHLVNSGYDVTFYDDSKYLMVIEIFVNDKPYKFQVNTGLPYSYIDDPLADVFGMQTKTIDTVLTGGVPVAEGELKNFRIGASVIPSRVFRVTRLEATGLKNSGAQIDGVLGFDFLQEFGVVIEYNSGDPKTIPKENKGFYIVPSAGS